MSEQRPVLNQSTPSGRPPRRVFVDGLDIVASVGVYEVEHRYEQRVLISLDLSVHDDYDGASERLDRVLDYGALVAGIEQLAQSAHFKLIETLAERIGEHCLADARVLAVKVRIEKPDVIANVRSVGIEIERRR